MSLKDKRKSLQAKLNQQQSQQPKMLNDRYQVVEEIGKGVSSTVYLAIDTFTKEKVAIKKFKESLEVKFIMVRIIREVMIMRRLYHPNIVRLRDIMVDNQECRDISLVMDYMPKDIKKILKSNRALEMVDIQRLILQLLAGLQYCQTSNVVHRDLKPENILVSDNLQELKLCDFGLARTFHDDYEKEIKLRDERLPMQQDRPTQLTNNRTVHVATRWYRAPEVILLQRNYTSAIDMWAVGCILGQLLSMHKQNAKNLAERRPLFPGRACYPLSPPKNEDVNYQKVNEFPHSVHDQLSMIFSILGTPSDYGFLTEKLAISYIQSFEKIPKRPWKEIFRFIPPEVQNFLECSLEFNPSKRMTVAEAITHPLFDGIRGMYYDATVHKGEPLDFDISNDLSIQDLKKILFNEFNLHQQSLKSSLTSMECES